MARILPPEFQVFKNSVHVGGAQLFFYEPGTSTKKTTFSDDILSTANTNPIVCDADGKLSVDVFADDFVDFKMVIAPADDTDPPIAAIITYDPLIDLRNTGPANILSFGADTSLDDNSTAIQAALDAALDVYIPEGEFTILSGLVPRSNQKITGGGSGSILKCGAGITVFDMNDGVFRENIVIRDINVDGGGQTTDIFTGIAGASCLRIENAKDILVENVHCKDMGVVKSAIDPKDDVGFGGFGFHSICTSGPLLNIQFVGCSAENIAGGGSNVGDGFYTAGRADTGDGFQQQSVIFDRCWAKTCGRHGFAAAGTTSNTISNDVSFINCYAENTALDGIDIESGENIIIDQCRLISCGNDQTYFDPEAEYGTNFRLFAAIAFGNSDHELTISNVQIRDSYYGITFGATDNVTISNVRVENSVRHDFVCELASGPVLMTVTNCQFLSNLPVGEIPSVNGRKNITFSNCFFGGDFDLRNDRMDFNMCTFAAGVSTFGNFATTGYNKFIGCTFTDFVGDGVDLGSSDNTLQFIFSECIFIEETSMVNGIHINFDGGIFLKVINCTFVGMTTGILGSATSSKNILSICSGNQFNGVVDGISLDDGTSNGTITSNTFNNISGWCIEMHSITTTAMEDTIISNNNGGPSIEDGIRVQSSGSGTFDWLIITDNNFRNASGTNLSLTGGQNANGLVNNNL